MSTDRQKPKVSGKEKDFLLELEAFAQSRRELIEAECSGFASDAAARDMRRTRAQDDFGYFAQTYFPHYVKGDPSVFHTWFNDTVPKKISDVIGWLINISAPRGEAKSTLGTQLMVIWCDITGRKHFVPIVMDAFDQSATMLEAIKVELEDNPRLRMDFPDRTGRGRVWNASVILTVNNTKIQAFGALKRMRGLRHGPHRPDLVVLDDIENDENVLSKEQRDKKEKWVTKVILNLGPPNGTMDVLYLNTILHHDSVANRFHKKPRWLRKKFQAILRWPDRMDLWQRWEELFVSEGMDGEEVDPSDSEAQAFYEANKADMLQGAQVSWPNVRPLLALMQIRAEDHQAFDCEYQNDPTNEETATFTNMQFWHAIGHDWIYLGVNDPSMGKSARKGDPSCILVGGGHSKTNKLHIVEASLARLKPDVQIAKMIAWQEQYDCVVWGVEDTAFQEYYRQQLVLKSAALGVPIPAVGIRNDRDKDILIEAVAPHSNNGLILYNPAHTVFNDNVKHYPEAAHDDGADGLQMLWRLWIKRAFGVIKIRLGKKRS
jgi:predicted phage terminase large subunit-like protein